MKPSDKQKELAKLIQSQAGFWLNTNDINSPTHEGDVGEEVRLLTLNDTITDNQVKVLEAKILDLYYFIRDIEKHENKR
jgi:hypothetical protein